MDDAQYDLLVDITEQINGHPGISAEGLKGTLYPDDIISAIHNHLGNANQLLSGSREAANGAEQFTALKAAQRELDNLRDSLLTAVATDMVSQAQYEQLSTKIIQLIELISDSTDPEYG